MQKKNKKKGKPHPFLNFSIYLLTRIVGVLINLATADATDRIACHVGSALYLVYTRGRRRAVDNLTRSYPNKDPDWIARIARQSFQHIVMLVFDCLRNERQIRLSNWRQYIELGDISRVLRLILQNRGLIMISGHYGNFIVLGQLFARLGIETTSVAREIDNPYISRFLYEQCQPAGHTVIYKKNATQIMLEVLEKRSILNFVADQNAGRKGIFVDFFGRQASTYKSIGLLAMQYDLPIVIGYCRRLENRYRFKIGLSRLIMPEEWQNKPDPLGWITAEYTVAIEAFIREEPGQYWWLHRRWKTRPPGEENNNS